MGEGHGHENNSTRRDVEIKSELDKLLETKRKYYDELNKGIDCCQELGDSLRESAEEKLFGDPKTKDYASKVVGNWCCAYEWGKKVLHSTNYWCYYFYYWLGSKIPAKPVNKSWKDTMKIIYHELQDPEGRGTCKIIYDNIEREVFRNMQKLYNFHYDYDTIEGQLELSKYYCDEELRSYLDEIYEAYEDIKEQCIDEGCNEQYCKDFSTMFDDDKYENLLKKKCSTETRTEHRAIEQHLEAKGEKFLVVREEPSHTIGLSNPTESSSPSTTGSDSTIAPGAVAGGTIATIGIPTIGFFLYKYTDVFDGIKKTLFGGSNNTGGRSRGRRSTFRHNDQHFDGFDSSTLGGDGSTTLGGGGGDSSTLGGSSTDVSTIYDDGGRRPSGRTRATNNRRPGNIRYYAT
ncbi:KIR protein [Plasmodium knowlesi strain H]|uniref:PIR protein n=3 Tax=Plasmodium knowlesi TaxID=5850 RepID=A0A1A7W312_PLAKH|nr:KIR protein [Plasmodium knowlesi strain H]OTN66070.1 PIR protein [Plasmodium knowlesi]CAA9987900.1 KIR protein [Plasmodium knowlesi strain H]SBO22255.1 KIR protein [Plasmodium knowlesi strain H]SBO28833.1 KIR protein [Plasmodium knowlesi strain H]VVS77374.1 KIR protein [Plasmodium knowlesi strain H]